MTSRNGNIQLLYNKIKELKPWDWTNCDCSNDTCENCSSLINSLQQQYKLFRKNEMDNFIKIILGIHEGNTFVCNYLKFDSPFSKVTDTSEIVWSSVDYHIVFIDEFDAIAKMRDYDQKDSGEMKRLVNTIIQLIDYLPNNIIVITATNYKEILDTAILRRFQVQLEFKLPTDKLLDLFYNSLLSQYPEKYRIIQRTYNISYAEAKNIVFKELKRQIILEEELKLNM